MMVLIPTSVRKTLTCGEGSVVFIHVTWTRPQKPREGAGTLYQIGVMLGLKRNGKKKKYIKLKVPTTIDLTFCVVQFAQRMLLCLYASLPSHPPEKLSSQPRRTRGAAPGPLWIKFSFLLWVFLAVEEGGGETVLAEIEERLTMWLLLSIVAFSFCYLDTRLSGFISLLFFKLCSLFLSLFNYI